jgi:hypothetical protein
MALLRTVDQGPAGASLALLESFDHVIVYLPEEDLWLDGTAAGHDPFLPPAVDQGALTLVIDPATTGPLTTPSPGAGESQLSYTLRAGEGGMLELQVRAEERGDAATLRRAMFLGSTDPERYARWLQQQFPGAELVAEPNELLVPGRDPAIFELEALVPRAALTSGGGIPCFPDRLEVVPELAPSEDRRTPLMMRPRPELTWTLEVELGRRPTALPQAVELDSEHGSLHLDFRQHDHGYSLEGRLRLAAGMVAADQAESLRAFLVAVARHLSRPLEVP